MTIDPILLDSLVRNVHVTMLVVCLGLAIIADLTAAKSISRPLGDVSLKRLHRNHKALVTGLFLLWVSGAALIYTKTGFDAAQFSPKLWAKVIVVNILTLNAFVIGGMAMRTFEENRGKTFGQFGLGRRTVLAISAAISTASWLGAFCLGAFPHLKTASPEVLSVFLTNLYTVCLAGGLFMAVFSALVRPTTPPAAQNTQQPPKKEFNTVFASSRPYMIHSRIT